MTTFTLIELSDHLMRYKRTRPSLKIYPKYYHIHIRCFSLDNSAILQS